MVVGQRDSEAKEVERAAEERWGISKAGIVQKKERAGERNLYSARVASCVHALIPLVMESRCFYR